MVAAMLGQKQSLLMFDLPPGPAQKVASQRAYWLQIINLTAVQESNLIK